MSDDEREFAMCDYCEDERGLCDRPHLVEGRRFSIKLQETFDVETVRNDDKCFLLFLHDFSASSTCNFRLLQFD